MMSRYASAGSFLAAVNSSTYFACISQDVYKRQGIDHAPVTVTEKSIAQLAGDGYEGIRGVRDFLSSHVGLPVQGLPLQLADGSTHYDVAALALLEAVAMDQPEKSTRRPGWTSRFTKR